MKEDQNTNIENNKKEQYKFFQHSQCEYFPCHKRDNSEHFNCLFCYCPLYLLKDKCGGNFTYDNPWGIKDCSNCLVPHGAKAYEYIMEKSKDLVEQAKLK